MRWREAVGGERGGCEEVGGGGGGGPGTVAVAVAVAGGGIENVLPVL